MSNSDKLKLIASVGICLGAGGVGSVFTASSVGSWYHELDKPPLTPPAWVFGPVWTTLYILMGIALFLVWRRVPLTRSEIRAMTWFGVQLAVNVLWSFLFFSLRQPGLAFVEIAFLWLAIGLTLVHFWRLSKPAGILLTPYLVWVSFASYLNFAIWRLNS